jgi:hypothetical protein
MKRGRDMKSTIRLNQVLRLLRPTTIKAIGVGGSTGPTRRRSFGGGSSWGGYSTIATGSSGAAFTEIERAVDRVVEEVLRTSPRPYGANLGGGGFGNGGNGGTTGYAGGGAFGEPAAVAIASYAVATRQPDLRSEVRTLAGLDGRISPAQAILARQVTPLLNDLLGAARTLADAADDDYDEAQSLLKLIADQVGGILAEVEGPEPPRDPRVDAYLDALGNGRRQGLIFELADAAEVTPTMDIVSPEDQVLVTTLRLLRGNADLIAQHWQAYVTATAPGTTDSLGERLAAASRLMPVIADAANTLTAELAAVGFTRLEAASASGDLSTIDGPVPGTSLPGILPDISFDRLLDWLEKWTADEGPKALAEGSRHALERVAAQADALYVVVAGVLTNVIALTSGGNVTPPRLADVLARRRVQPILGRLVVHLDSMAGLA